METTEKVDGQCKGGHGDKEISFPTTYDQHTKQHRVETSGSSLIVISKMMEERKEGLDKSKMLLVWSTAKPIDQTLNYFVFVSVSSRCSLLFCDFTLLYTQCQIDCDNMSTLLLAIISLKHVTAYSCPCKQHRRL